MTKCVVTGCKSDGTHKFPDDKKTRSTWIKVIRRPDLKESNSRPRICKQHFIESDYKVVTCTGFKSKRKMLKKFAIPTIFPWTKPPSDHAAAREVCLNRKNIKKQSQHTQTLEPSKKEQYSHVLVDMGAKTPTKLKLRRASFKCEECDKPFFSPQGLKAHKILLHKMKGNIKPKGKLMNLLGKSVKRASKVERPRRHVAEESHVSDVRKIEYECPQCISKFSVYFSAYRHIQRFHCIDSQGNKVAFHSPKLIKPIRVETCIKCNTRMHPSEPHSCTIVHTELISKLGTECVCMGCQQTFSSVLKYDMHVSGLHSDGVVTFFFPNIHSFTQWKDHMENYTQIKYLVLGNNFKQTYRCTYTPPSKDNDDKAYFCPSSIIVKEYSKSVQVHFYKEHHGHTVQYKIPDRFQKFLSTEVMKKSINATGSTEEDDLYTKFKNVLDSIAVAAYNADTETLKMLYRTAVEMEKIVKREEEPVTVTKKMTDKQITETLESFSEKKSEIEVPSETEPNGAESDKDQKPLIEEIKVESNINNADMPIACFNDSYKEFCNKINEKNKVVKKSPPKKMTVQKNVRSYIKRKVVKTKMGQFKPNILSPKKMKIEEKIDDSTEDVDFESDDDTNIDELKSNSSLSSSKIKVEMNYEVIEQEDDCNILVLKI